MNKSQLRKDINNQLQYVNDLIEQAENQYPQPSGKIYLHGEWIRPSDIHTEINRYNIYVMMYNSTGKKRLQLLEHKTCINKHTGEPFKMFNKR